MYIKNPTPLQVPSSDNFYVVNGRKYQAIPPMNEPGSIIDIDDQDGDELLKIYEFLQVIDDAGKVVRTGPDKPWLTTQDPRENLADKVYRHKDGSLTVNGVKYIPEYGEGPAQEIKEATYEGKKPMEEVLPEVAEATPSDTTEGEDLLADYVDEGGDSKKKAQ